MRFGVNTLLWTVGFDRAHLALLDKAREMGFDGIEISRFDFESFPAAEIRQAAAGAGLECTFCSALTGSLSLVSEEAAARRQAADFLRRGIETAAELGAKVFMGPFCAPVGYLPGRRRTEEEWKRAVEGLQALGETLEAAGVTLVIEPLNRFETYFLNTAADGARLCDEVGHERVRIALDTFHANIEEKSISGAVRALGPRLGHVHACENDRGVPGSGHVEWREVFGALRETGYEGWVVIESFGAHIPEIAAAACIWRDLAPSADELAREGVRFLRSL